MRTMVLLAAGVTLVAGLAGGPAAAKAAPKAKPTNVTGIVTRLNTPAKSFVLERKTGWGKRAKTEDLTVMTSGATTFKQVGRLPLTRKPASFTDLAVNEKVQVRGLPANAGRVGATYVLIKQMPRK